MFALEVELTNPYVRKRYTRFYELHKLLDHGITIAYELFDLARKEPGNAAALHALPFFLLPGEKYLNNVYGLIGVRERSDFPGLIQDQLLDIRNLSFIGSEKATKVQHFKSPHQRITSRNTPIMMGILNVTPDSFSDGGKNYTVDTALQNAREMVDCGISIIDIGGESTRPGSERVGLAEELRRVIPVVEAIHDAFPEILISVDTWKSEVASESAAAGAGMINDISGGVFDERIFAVAKEYGCDYVLMHTLGDPKIMQQNPVYTNPVLEIIMFLLRQAEKAGEIGLANIIFDPGIGFGKTIDDNFEILSRLKEFCRFGFPVLIGVSRKSFIGKTLELEVSDRDTASSLIELFSLINGASIIRTHNAKLAYQLLELYKHLNGTHA